MNKARVPEVRMTKAARLRLLEANPIIKYEIERTKNTTLINHLNLDTVSHLNQAIIDKSVSGLCSKGLPQIKFKEPETLQISKPKPKTKTNNPSVKNLKTDKPGDQNPRETQRKPIYRSMSVASNLKPRAGGIKKSKKEERGLSQFDRSVSLDNIPSAVDTISYERQSCSTFKAPLDNQPSTSRRSFIPVTPSAPVDLKRRLSEWLSKCNKKPTSFKHLKCFGVHKIEVINEDDKENVDTSRVDEQGSYENLNIQDAEVLHKESEEQNSLIIAPSDLERVAKGALNDLHCLISEGYPKEQCEAWLKVIQNKFTKVVQEPMYWECRASIEQLRGDLGSAIECYTTAVVHGAEVSSVEEALDQLLHKFKLLEIDDPITTRPTANEAGNDRVKIVKDFRNVFTSMIIKFAIQEKNLKTKSRSKNSNNGEETSIAKILVTPVRRSARMNRSVYTSTPGTQLFSSLLEVPTELREQMDFQTNPALC